MVDDFCPQIEGALGFRISIDWRQLKGGLFIKFSIFGEIVDETLLCLAIPTI